MTQHSAQRPGAWALSRRWRSELNDRGVAVLVLGLVRVQHPEVPRWTILRRAGGAAATWRCAGATTCAGSIPRACSPSPRPRATTCKTTSRTRWRPPRPTPARCTKALHRAEKQPEGLRIQEELATIRKSYLETRDKSLGG